MRNHKLLHSCQGIKSTVLLLVAVVALSLFSHKVEAEILFEGYYKVSLSGVHSGYAIQRYEFDAKKKEFKGYSFAYVRLSPDGKQFLNESLVATSTDAFQPVKYQYSKLQTEADPTRPGKMKSVVSTIDGSFKKLKDGSIQGTLSGIKDDKNYAAKPIFKKGIFLSNFLIYLLLQKGLQSGRGFAFEAIAEESGDMQKGQIQIKEENNFRGISAYKMDWAFKGISSLSFISQTGDALATESVTQGVVQELVATKALAIGSLTFPEKSIKAVFGNIPDGKVNAVYKLASEPAKAQPPPKPKAKGFETEQ